MNFDDIISVVKRENNKKRKFLFLNKYQAKYIPTDPSDAIALFSHLADKIKKDGKKTVVIGFAETATAIGAIVCEHISNSSFYIHSTREDLGKLDKITFEEEHSHAKNHELCIENIDIFKNCERLVFVDDECTTGKTICNFIKALAKKNIINNKVEIVVTTLVNCMKDNENFRKSNIDYQFIISEERDWNEVTWEGDAISDIVNKFLKVEFNCIYIANGQDTKKGIIIGDYKQAVDRLAESIDKESLIEDSYKEILIIGTEECMYPAIKVAEHLKNKYQDKKVLCYATSRSPIQVLDNENYILFNRAKFTSFYNQDRMVYLYNLKKYDKIIVITDAKKIPKETLDEFVSILVQFGNKDIDFVMWESE